MMKLVKLLPLIFIGLFIASCSSDDGKQLPYKGDLSVTLINDGNNSAIEGEAKEFVYQIILSKSFDKKIELEFGLENPQQNDNILEIENPVVIEKGSTKGVLKIRSIGKPDAENSLTEMVVFPIVLKSLKGVPNEFKLTEKHTIVINPEEGFTPLTKEQKELLAYYKEKGMDLSKWIGKIPVKAKVVLNPNGGFAPFDQVKTVEYEGVTHITLSENATKERPLLKMTRNAFGLNEYLQWVFRHETIENTEYWYNPDSEYVNPAGKVVLKALGNERVQKWINKEYKFNVSVDELLVKDDNTIEFVRENGAYDTYSNFLEPQNLEKNLSAVNFNYHFELWDELVPLTQGNDELKTAIQQGGSIYPNNYIGTSTILEDDWGEGVWVAPTSSYDNNKGEMTFNFDSDHTNSGGYDLIYVTYTSPYKK